MLFFLNRYLHSWTSHGLLMEYYEDTALVRDLETSNLLPNMAGGNFPNTNNNTIC